MGASDVPGRKSKDTESLRAIPLPQAMHSSWSERLDELLSATDGNVARIKVKGRPGPIRGCGLKDCKKSWLTCWDLFLL